MRPLYSIQQSPKIPTTSGIYRMRNTVNQKLYIGSATNLRRRWWEHSSKLQNNYHHSISLQRAWIKYGENAFVFEIVELVLAPFLIEREQYWLDKIKPFGHDGYNINITAGSRLGTEVSQATRKKISDANLGKPSNRLGAKLTPETKEKLRLANLGNERSEETKRKISETTKGKTYSPETKEKLRISAESQMKTMIFTDPNGTEYIAHGISHFAKKHNLDRNHLVDVALGRRNHHKGWKARFP